MGMTLSIYRYLIERTSNPEKKESLRMRGWAAFNRRHKLAMDIRDGKITALAQEPRPWTPAR